jgi:rubrerythrin
VSTQLETAPVITTITDEETDTGEPIVTHIVGKQESQSAGAKVLGAYVEGTAITALCGYTWVPSRNPENHPLCQKCKEIWEFDKQFNS